MTERPRRMTIAAVVAMTTCALLVVTLLDAMVGLRTLDSVQRMRQLVDAQGWSSLHDDQVIAAQRVLIFVSGALAATGVVLSVFTLRRHRGARALLGVVAGLLLFSTALVSTLLPLVLIVAVVMMWTGDAGDWFAGRERRARPAPTPPPPGPSPVQEHWPPPAVRPAPPAPAPEPPTDAPEGGPPSAPSPAGPPRSDPYGPPPSAPGAYPPPPAGAAPYPSFAAPTGPFDPYAGPATPAARPRPSGEARPVTVSVAVWLTAVVSGLTFVVFALMVTLLLVARDEVVRALREQNLSVDLGVSERDLLALVWVTCAVCLFWSLAAIALAVLAYRRVHIARVALVVSAGVTAVVGFAAVPVGWLNAVAAVATAGLLFAGGANRWYARGGRPAWERQVEPRTDADDERQDGSSDGPAGGPPSTPPRTPPSERPRDKPPVW